MLDWSFVIGFVSALVCVTIFRLLNKKKKKIELSYYFEYSIDGCLWHHDIGFITDSKKLKKMGLSEKTIKKSKELVKEFQSSIDLNNTQNELWDEHQWDDFYNRAHDLYIIIKEELKDNYIVSYHVQE